MLYRNNLYLSVVTRRAASCYTVTRHGAKGLFKLMEVYVEPKRYHRECGHWWFDCWDWAVNTALSWACRPRIAVRPGEVAIDPHIHTLFSHCSISQPKKIILRAVRLGLGGVAIMDHSDIRGARDAAWCAADLKAAGAVPEDFLVIPGVEVNSASGHIGALFVDEILPDALSVEETVRVIHEAGGLAVAVHPYHAAGIGGAVFDAPFDAVEVECGSVFSLAKARKNQSLAQDLRLSGMTKLGSSDAHYAGAVGSCYSVINGIQQPTLQAAREAIANGRCAARSSEPWSRLRSFLSLMPIAK